MKGNLGSMMQKLQEAQEKMKNVQDDLENVEIIGESGGGLVKIHMNGKRDVQGVFIDDEVFSEDKEFLEDLIAAAINSAVKKVEEVSQNKISDLATGFGLPPGFKMPF